MFQQTIIYVYGLFVQVFFKPLRVKQQHGKTKNDPFKIGILQTEKTKVLDIEITNGQFPNGRNHTVHSSTHLHMSTFFVTQRTGMWKDFR